MTTKKLSPTSYVLLGLLARRSWSAYELNIHMQKSILTAFWPRTESHVYSEPKKLLAEGLVSANKEEHNGRLRTVYSITEDGHKALQRWLTSPTEGYAAIHYEAMLKFLCADRGDIETLRKNVRAIAEGAIEEARLIGEGIDDVRNSTPINIRGMPYNAMAINFLLDVVEARLRWVEEIEAGLADFSNTQECEETTREGEKYYKLAQARLARILAKSNK